MSGIAVGVGTGLLKRGALTRAMGWGATLGHAAAPGGWTTYHVTNLATSGAGSLNNGLATVQDPGVGLRIVFDVGGTIGPTASKQRITNHQYFTLDGATAPSPVNLVGTYVVDKGSSNVLIRHLSFRPGDGTGATASERRGLDVVNETGTPGVDDPFLVTVDHCSMEWGIDGNVELRYANRVTFQYCLIAECLDCSIHTGGGTACGIGQIRHSKGIVTGTSSSKVSLIRCVLTANADRNPNLPSPITAMDMVECLVAGWVQGAVVLREDPVPQTDPIEANIVRNKFIEETATTGKIFETDANIDKTKVKIYVEGNLKEDALGAITTGAGEVDGDWNILAPATTRADLVVATPVTPVNDAPTPIAWATLEPLLLSTSPTKGAGRTLPSRDATDARIIADLVARKVAVPDQEPADVQPIDPTTLASLALWLKGDVGVTVTGAGVSTWADQSGNGRDFTQSTDADRPPKFTSWQNGKDAVGPADGVSEFLSNAAMPSAVSAYTLALALEFPTSGAAEEIFGSATNGRMIRRGVGNDIVSLLSGASVTYTSGITLSAGKYIIIIGNTGSNAWAYVNGQDYSSGAAEVLSTQLQFLFADSAGPFGNLTLGEVLYYTADHRSKAEDLDRYLNNRWAIHVGPGA